MKTLQLKAQLQPGKRYKDGSVGITFITAEEIDTEMFSLIDSWRSQSGWLLFRLNEFTEIDIPKSDAEIEGEEPLWKRQQRTIYKLFMLRGGKPAEFHTFYRNQMNLIQQRLGDVIEKELPNAEKP